MSWRGSRGMGLDRIAAVAQTVKARTGGRLVAECLEALGAEVAFGVPGIHALAVWDGLRTSPIRTVGLRTELSAGFAADGYARTSGRPAPLLLSTGPGALISLAALMEAASAHVPVVAIASQIPRDLIGAGRGFLHELPDQKASFAPVVKWAARAESAGEIPELLAESWRRALTPPSGPVFVEIPVDLLAARDGRPGRRAGRDPRGAPAPRRARSSTRLRACSRAPPLPSSGPAAACSAPVPGRSCARSPSGSARRWRRPTWARARSPRTTRSPSARRWTRRPSGSSSPAPTSLLAVGTELGRGDDRALRPRALGPPHPRRRRPAPDRGELRGARSPGRREGRARRAARAAPGPAEGRRGRTGDSGEASASRRSVRSPSSGSSRRSETPSPATP